MEKVKLAQEVKKLRKRKGLSQEELAYKAGLSLRTIQRVENGETEPTGETLKRISNAFDLSPEELIIWTNNEDELKHTVAAKNEYLHIFDNRLTISKTNEFNDSIDDYDKSVNNVFKSLIVFLVSIPIFTALAVVFYNTHPNLSFYAGGFALFFLLMAIYIMLFTSGTPLIYRNQIKNIELQSSIFGNAIVIKHYDMGRLKRRSIIVDKNKIELIKDVLLEEKLSNNADIKTDKKRARFEGSNMSIVFFIIFFVLFEKSILGEKWVYGFILSAFVLFLIIKGIIESHIWKKRQQQTANNGYK